MDDIPKLGESRRLALLEKFGSVAAIGKASVDELSEIPGIGPRIAAMIFANLNQEKSANTSINMETGEIT